MGKHESMSNTLAATQGSAALSFPVWSPFLADGWTVLIAVLGATVLILTIWSKVLEVKQRRKDLAEKRKE